MTMPPPDRETTTVPATDPRFDVPLCGVAVDPETLCVHWDGPVDVVALRFGCCDICMTNSSTRARQTAPEIPFSRVPR